MTISNALASVPVKDLRTSARWYQKLFGRPPDAQPMEEVLEWKFASGGEIQLYQLAERAGRGSATLVVQDIDDQRAELQAVCTEVPETIESTQFRVIMIKDPDGNSLAFAQRRAKPSY